MLVNLWMSRQLVTIPAALPIADAAGEMGRHRIRRLLVVQAAPREWELIGIVSLQDLVRAFPPHINPMSVAAREGGPREPVSDVMTRDPLTVAPDTPIEEAARLLAERKIGAVPVVEAGRLVGIITESDIFRAFVEMVGANVPGVRVVFDLSDVEDAVGVVLALGRRHDMSVVSVLSLERDGRRMGVLRLTGRGADRFIDELWRSGHPVLSVQRTEG